MNDTSPLWKATGDKREEVEERLYEWGKQLRKMSGHCSTPIQQLCREIADGIGELIGEDFSNVPATGFIWTDRSSPSGLRHVEVGKL